jgi:hypothetical protein
MTSEVLCIDGMLCLSCCSLRSCLSRSWLVGRMQPWQQTAAARAWSIRTWVSGVWGRGGTVNEVHDLGGVKCLMCTVMTICCCCWHACKCLPQWLWRVTLAIAVLSACARARLTNDAFVCCHWLCAAGVIHEWSAVDFLRGGWFGTLHVCHTVLRSSRDSLIAPCAQRVQYLTKHAINNPCCARQAAADIKQSGRRSISCDCWRACHTTNNGVHGRIFAMSTPRMFENLLCNTLDLMALAAPPNF